MQEAPETVPSAEKKQSPKAKKSQRYIKVYFRDTVELQTWADRSAAAGFRRGGLPIFTKKAHGFAGETVHNTDGISRYLKDCEEKVATANELSRVLRNLLKK
jgi:hypothetical protein